VAPRHPGHVKPEVLRSRGPEGELVVLGVALADEDLVPVEAEGPVRASLAGHLPSVADPTAGAARTGGPFCAAPPHSGHRRPRPALALLSTATAWPILLRVDVVPALSSSRMIKTSGRTIPPGRRS